MEENEHMDEHLKNSLNEFLVPPRVTSFDEVLKKLAKKKRRRFLFFLFPGMLILLGSAFIFLENESFITSSSAPIAALKTETKIKSTEKAAEKRSIKKNRPVNTDPAKTPAELVPGKQKPFSDGKPGSNKVNKPGNNKVNKQDNNKLPEPSRLLTEPVKEKATIPEVHTGGDLTDDSLPTLADQLEQKHMLLPIQINDPGIFTDSLKSTEPLADKNDTTKKKRKIHFLTGLSFNPQIGSYHFLKHDDGVFADFYLKHKKSQNTFRFNYSFGLKAGIVIKEKWELLGGFGFQRYSQEEKVTGSGSAQPTFAYGFALQFDSRVPQAVINPNGKTYKSIYKYWNYSLECSRIYKLKSLMMIKAGAGLNIQQVRYLLNASPILSVADVDKYYYEPAYNTALNKYLCTVNFKAGFINDLGKKIQVQFCPNFFYSLNSTFKNYYVIKQKNYGLGLECLFLFKIG